MSQLAGIEFLESTIRMPLMDLPVRSTIVTLSNACVLISPIPSLPEKWKEAAISSQVTDIAAPSTFHHLGVPDAVRLFPNARLWGVPGLEQKRPDIWWKNVLTPDTWPYNDELKCMTLDGAPRINEVVFIHRASKTLIVTDLCFNLLDSRGLGAWIILHLFGTYNHFAISKFFLKFATDRPALERSLARILAEDFDNLVMGHGRIVLGGAKAQLREAMLERNLAIG